MSRWSQSAVESISGESTHKESAALGTASSTVFYFGGSQRLVRRVIGNLKSIWTISAFIARLPGATIDAVAFLRHPPTRSATTTPFFLTMKYQIR